MLNLIKKDLLIVKKMACVIVVLSLFIPMFFNFVSTGETLPFAVTNTSLILILSVMLFSSIYEEEEKFPKAKSLITTIGYDRETQIRERFLLALAEFVWVSVICMAESALLENLGAVTLKGFAISFAVFFVMMGLFFAFTTKFGIRASRYINIVIILLISLGPVLVQKLNIDFSRMRSVNDRTLISVCFLIGVLFYLGSYLSSVKSYNAQDF